MDILTIVTVSLLYLFTGYFLSIAFQEDGHFSFYSILLYPVVIAFLCILTLFLLILDGFSKGESEHMA